MRPVAAALVLVKDTEWMFVEGIKTLLYKVKCRLFGQGVCFNNHFCPEDNDYPLHIEDHTWFSKHESVMSHESNVGAQALIDSLTAIWR